MTVCDLTLSPHRMASFGWKRKAGEKVSKSVVQKFEAEAEKAENDRSGQEDEKEEEEDVDWLHAIKRRREVLLEDCAAKSKRLKDEGAMLAGEGRWVVEDWSVQSSSNRHANIQYWVQIATFNCCLFGRINGDYVSQSLEKLTMHC